MTINLHGAPFLSDCPAPSQLGIAEFNALKQEGATTLDVRPAPLFGDGHAVDSLNIGVASPSFSVWTGFFVNLDLPMLLVVDDAAEARRAQLELARIGFARIVGFIAADDLDETLLVSVSRSFSPLHTLWSNHFSAHCESFNQETARVVMMKRKLADVPFIGSHPSVATSFCASSRSRCPLTTSHCRPSSSASLVIEPSS